MRQYTVLVKEYNFDELPEEAQDKAIENLYDINVDYEWWDYDGLLDMSQAEMNSRHLTKRDGSQEWWENGSCLFSYKSKDISFDLDRRQYIQFADIVVNDDDIFRKFLRIDKRLWNKLDGCYHFQNNRLGSGSNTQLVFDTYYAEGNITDREQEIIDRASEIFADKVSEALSDLQSNYEYLTGRESIIETIKANEYSFDLNGILN